MFISASESQNIQKTMDFEVLLCVCIKASPERKEVRNQQIQPPHFTDDETDSGSGREEANNTC